MSQPLKHIILYGLIGTMIFTALAHGAVETWSLAVFELLIILLTLLWGIQSFLDKQLTLHIPHVIFPLGGLLIWGAIQGIAYTDQSGKQHSLSMDVEATRQVTSILFILILTLLITASFLAQREHLVKLPLFIAGYGLALALFGLIQYFAGDGRFFWLRQTSDSISSPFGPFVAHSHFAGYMELLLPLPMAFILLQVGRIEVRIFYGIAAALMGCSLIVSLSRGGIISLFAQIMFFVATIPLISRRNNQAGRLSSRRNLTQSVTPLLAILLIVVAISASVYWIGLEPVINRIAHGTIAAADTKEESFLVSRGWIWRDTLTMIRSHLLTGVGLGAFETTFPIYSQSDGSLQIGQAHNDYLQLIAETGIIGVALLVWFSGIVLSQTLRGIQIHDPLMAALALGSSGSLVGIMVHSVFDFNLQLPSHVLLMFLWTAILSQVSLPKDRSVIVKRLENLPEKALVNTASL